MKKNIRKSVFVIVLLLALKSQYAFAASNELGTLYYWEDGETDKIGRWGGRGDIPREVYIEKYGSNQSFHFALGMSHATDVWNDALGSRMYITLQSANKNSKIQFYGGTRAELKASQGVDLLGTELGKVNTQSYKEGWWKYKSTYKNGQLLMQAKGYIVDCGASTDAYKNTCMHELGHALGWWGHSSDLTAVMYWKQEQIRTTLSARDIRHISKVYK